MKGAIVAKLEDGRNVILILESNYSEMFEVFTVDGHTTASRAYVNDICKYPVTAEEKKICKQAIARYKLWTKEFQ